MADEAEEFLAHFGVKGMHWGKHKAAGAVEVSSSKNAPIDKTKLSAARKELYGKVGAHYKGNTKAKGAVVAGALLGGSAGSQIMGTQMMKAAGFSKGKSLTMGLIGGAPGAALAIELKARKMARS